MRVVYIDVWLYRAFLAGLMNAAVLWTTGKILRYPVKRGRILTAATVGAVYLFILGLRRDAAAHSLGGWETVLFFVVGAMMVLWAFPPNNRTKAFRVVLLFYFLTFVTVGLSWGLLCLSGLAAGNWAQAMEFAGGVASWQVLLLNLISLLFIAELGWGMVHEAVWTRTCSIPLRIKIDGISIGVTALVDTGHFLRDPLTLAPVVVLSFPAVKPLLPPKFCASLERLLEGDLPTAADERVWLNRLRLIPLTSVETGSGLLVGIVPEEVGWLCSPPRLIQNVVCGFSRQSFGKGEYQALFPAALVTELMEG